MTAPTEAEIRQLIADRSARYPLDSLERPLGEAIDKSFDTIGFVTLDERGRWDFGVDFLSDTWADLRPSEQERLGELIAAAKARAMERARESIIGETVAAALAFSAEHPDAKRASPEHPIRFTT